MKEELFFKNKLLNETEISQKKISLTSFPIRLYVILTNRCNLRCIMCVPNKNLREVPEKRLKEIIEYFPYLQIVCWQGGEVFLLKYFEELFEKASMYPWLRQVILTNGLLIDEKWAKKLARKNVVLSYSIDGATKRTYENIRKGARFEDLLKSRDIIKSCVFDKIS